MTEVVALGELLIDFATLAADEAGYPTMKANAGGAPGNYLAALCEYGHKTAFLGKVGMDAFGKMILGTLSSRGIDVSGVVSDPNCFTTLAFVTFDEHGDRTFSFARKPGADIMLTEGEVKKELIDEAKVFHFGTLSLTDSPVRETTKAMVAYAKEQGKLISFDPNLRMSLWDSAERAKQSILWGLSMSDVVKISDEEIEFLWNCTPDEGIDRLLHDYGVSLVLATLGPKGSIVANGRGRVFCGTPKVTVKDTTGAGDIFGGSAMSRLLELGTAPGELTEDQLRQIGTFAGTAASLSTQYMGGIPSIRPRSEVEAVLNGY